MNFACVFADMGCNSIVILNPQNHFVEQKDFSDLSFFRSRVPDSFNLFNKDFTFCRQLFVADVRFDCLFTAFRMDFNFEPKKFRIALLNVDNSRFLF